MVVSRGVIINHDKGLHARVLAMVVHKANEIQKKYNVELFIRYKDKKKLPATSMMPLVHLKVKKKDKVIVEALGENPENALGELCEYLQSDFNEMDENTINQMDSIINNNTMTLEQVFNNIPNGVIAVDENDVITIFNPQAERILKIYSYDAIGRKVYEVIPDTNLHQIRKSGKAQITTKMIYEDSIILINRTPIIIDGKSKGAMSVFNDISNLEKIKEELKEVKDLKERLQLIFETVQDGICVINVSGLITYVNKAYADIINDDINNLIGKNIYDISPNGVRMKVLKERKSILGAISYKKNDVTIVSNVSPIIVDGEITGVVSIVKNISEIQSLSEKLRKITEKANYLEQELIRVKKPEAPFANYIGYSGKVLDALATANKAAKTDSTVLIRGESGTGKELIAEGIHYASNSSKGPFIRVNCAAIPHNLLESELFGHEKGAFTGAIKRILGKFELAQNGTIFLDEIGEMDKSMQAKILRVIQEKEFHRVGGEQIIKLNVRIIAATHRNLEMMVKEGEFREDLYYRLNVIPIYLAPLRERKWDIAPLLEHFINKIGKRVGKRVEVVTNEAMEALLNYKWAGNVRELENLVERIMAFNETDKIDLKDLPPYIRNEPQEVVVNVNREEKDSVEDFITKGDEILPMAMYEKIIIEKALKQYGSFNAAGKVLGLTHKTVAAKARKYGIEKNVTWEKRTT